MTRSSLNQIADRLTAKFGLHFTARAEDDAEGPVLRVAPADLAPTEGFSIPVTVAWRHLRAEFVPDSFARPLLLEMAEADEESRIRSTAFARAGRQAGLTLEMSLNQRPVDPVDAGTWLDDWNRLAVTATLPHVTVESRNEDELIRQVLRIVEPVMGMVLSLLPLEEPDQPEAEVAGLPEGAVKRVEVNRYERSRLNRAACIAARGAACAVCNFDFEQVYGPLGAGFIHVHHVTPVSQLGPGYRIDPVRDLVPVCPNCHAMLHREVPPLSAVQLREVMAEQRQEVQSDEGDAPASFSPSPQQPSFGPRE